MKVGDFVWSQGTDYIYERGSLSLFNCQFVEVTALSKDTSHIMDSLMAGVGVGLSGQHFQGSLTLPSSIVDTYVIPDTREGWVESVRRLVESYERGSQTVEFDYSEIRPAGELIKGFGGVASGSGPLEKLHIQLRQFLDENARGETSPTRLVIDIANAIGGCVVAGNIRRSAELALGSIHDNEFLNLKNYDLYPERREWGWMSNNSVRLEEIADFAKLGELSERIRDNAEPGIFNLVNVKKYGRYGEEMFDSAVGTNPCAEATLESYETCNLCELFPTRAKSPEEFYEAARLATLYASTVSLLPTSQPETNEVVARNRRIGVSISGIADWFDQDGATTLITMLRKAYRVIEEANKRYAREAGVPESIRKTLIKPSGTVSQLAGVSSGMHYPNYNRFIRRIRVGENTPIVRVLEEAGVPYEMDKYSDNTCVFEFPVESKAKRAQKDLSMWEKGAMVVLLQRHFTDQMVSNTITFDPKTEGHQIENFLAFTVPLTKSISLLPDAEGVYEQMPYEAITKGEFDRRAKEIKDIDWTKFGGSDGQDSRFCTTDSCEV